MFMKNRDLIISGLSLFFCFCILSSSSYIINLLFSNNQAVGIIIIEILAFLIPAIAIKMFSKDSALISFRLLPKKHAVKSIGFTIKFALALSFLSFLSNYVIYLLGKSEVSMSFIVPHTNILQSSNILSFVAIAVVPALAEEIFMRGALFSLYEKNASTLTAIFMTGLCFGMIHGTSNFIGPFLAGCGYAYLTYVFDSIWPAVIAHIINNIYYIFINRFLSIYDTFGIWDYFPHIILILFLLFAYLSFRSLENLLEKGYIKPLKKIKENSINSFLKIVLNPAFIAFIFAFSAKYILKLF